MTGEIVWRPNAEMVADSKLTAFMNKLGVADYDALVAYTALTTHTVTPGVRRDL